MRLSDVELFARPLLAADDRAGGAAGRRGKGQPRRRRLAASDLALDDLLIGRGIEGLRLLHDHPHVRISLGERVDVVILAVTRVVLGRDRKSTRLNSSHTVISYAVFCLKKKKHN